MTVVAADKQRFYDTIADTFDDVMNPYDIQRRLEVVFDDLLDGIDLRGTRFLDAGAGTGRFSERATLRGARVTSIDIGPALLRVVRGKCNAVPVCADVTLLPFPDGSFDVVVSSECIEHTPSPRQAVAELVRVCRPGGHLVITCPNRAWRWSCSVANAFGLRPYDGLENWPGWWQLRRWIRQAGGRPLRSTGIHLFPFMFQASQPILRRLDGLGRLLGPIYVNQAVLATR